MDLTSKFVPSGSRVSDYQNVRTAGVDQPKLEPALNMLHSGIVGLVAAIDRLEKQLGPVLGPEGPLPAEAVAGALTPMSSALYGIFDAERKVSEQVWRLSRLMDRLDL